MFDTVNLILINHQSELGFNAYDVFVLSFYGATKSMRVILAYRQLEILIL